MNWDDEIPADAVVRQASAAGAPLGDFKMICFDRQVRGHTFQSYSWITLKETRGKLMTPWWNLKAGYFGKRYEVTGEKKSKSEKVQEHKHSSVGGLR